MYAAKKIVTIHPAQMRPNDCLVEGDLRTCALLVSQIMDFELVFN